MSLNKDSKVLFLVTSAINTLFGNNEKTRFAETIGTINSINANFNNADIILIEAGFRKIGPRFTPHLPKNVKVKYFYEDPNIKQFMKDGVYYSVDAAKRLVSPEGKSIENDLKLSFIKNTTECYIFKNTLTDIDYSKYDRVFKLSGRYLLSPVFNIKDHSKKGKVVIHEKYPSNQALITESPFLHFCFLWSFCPSMSNDIKELYDMLEAWLDKRFSKRTVADIEHGIYHLLDSKKIHGIKPLGVFARIGEKEWVLS